MRILITGASGLLGGRLATLLSSDHQTAGLVHHREAPEGVEAFRADITDQDGLVAALDRARPEAVVHCAALADAEICEREPVRTRQVNVTATRALGAACRALGARLITISTDLVFGGESAFSKETSPTHPLTEYARSKVAAEEATLETSPDSAVLRVALVSGRGHGPRRTATESLAHRMGAGEVVTLYEDEWRTPVDPESVAEAVRALLRRPRVGGCFHLGGPERIDRVELGERVARAFGLDVSLIRRARRASHPGAPRPADVSLDTTRAREELGWTPRSLDAALREGRLA